MLRAALARRGVDAGTAVWSDPGVDWSAYDLVLANGTWDNIHHTDEFLAWVDRVSGTLGVTVVNSPAVLRWNIDKRYLRDLDAAGVPIVPTLWVEPGGEPGRCRTRRTTRIIGLRPARRGDRRQAVGLRRRVPDGALPAPRHGPARRHVADLTASGRAAMVQRYQRAVDDVGEVGLIFLGGTFSHAMHKDPMIRPGTGPGPSLIENQVVTPASPSAAQLALGRAAVAAAEHLHGPTSYARVDTVEGDDGRPLLLELELLDPALFFVTDPGGAERFAGVLARRARLLPPPRPGSATGVTGRPGRWLSPRSAPLPRRARPPGS